MPRLHGTQFRRVGCLADSSSSIRKSTNHHENVKNKDDSVEFDDPNKGNTNSNNCQDGRLIHKGDSFDFHDDDNDCGHNKNNNNRQVSQTQELLQKSTTSQPQTTKPAAAATTATTTETPAGRKNVSLVTPTTIATTTTTENNLTTNNASSSPSLLTTATVLTEPNNVQQQVQIIKSTTSSSRSRKRKTKTKTKKKSSFLSLNDVTPFLPETEDKNKTNSETETHTKESPPSLSLLPFQQLNTRCSNNDATENETSFLSSSKDTHNNDNNNDGDGNDICGNDDSDNDDNDYDGYPLLTQPENDVVIAMDTEEDENDEDTTAEPLVRKQQTLVDSDNDYNNSSHDNTTTSNHSGDDGRSIPTGGDDGRSIPTGRIHKPGSKVLEVIESPIKESLLLCGGIVIDNTDAPTPTTTDTTPFRKDRHSQKYEDVKWMDSVVASSHVPFSPPPILRRPHERNNNNRKEKVVNGDNDDTGYRVDHISHLSTLVSSPKYFSKSRKDSPSFQLHRTTESLCCPCVLTRSQWRSTIKVDENSDADDDDEKAWKHHILNFIKTNPNKKQNHDVSFTIGEPMFSLTSTPNDNNNNNKNNNEKIDTAQPNQEAFKDNDGIEDNDSIISLGTLVDVLNLHCQFNTGPIPEQTVAWITLSILQIVSELHRCNVAHNDLGLDSFRIVRRRCADDGAKTTGNTTDTDPDPASTKLNNNGCWQLQCTGLWKECHLVGTIPANYERDEEEEKAEEEACHYWHFEKDFFSIANIVCLLLLGGSPLSWENDVAYNGKLMVPLESKSFISDNYYLRGSMAWNDLIWSLLNSPKASYGAHCIDWTTVLVASEGKASNGTTSLSSRKSKHPIWSALTDACRLVKSVADPNSGDCINEIPESSKVFFDEISNHLEHLKGVGEGTAALGMLIPTKSQGSVPHEETAQGDDEKDVTDNANSGKNCENCDRLERENNKAREEATELQEKLQQAANEKASLLQQMNDMQLAIVELQAKCKSKDVDMRKLDELHQMKTIDLQEKYKASIKKRACSSKAICKQLQDEIQHKEEKNQELLQDMAGLRTEMMRQTKEFDERELKLTQKLEQARLEIEKLKGHHKTAFEKKDESSPSVSLFKNKNIEAADSLSRVQIIQDADQKKTDGESFMEPAQKQLKRSPKDRNLNPNMHQHKEARKTKLASPVGLFGLFGEKTNQNAFDETPKSSNTAFRLTHTPIRSSNLVRSKRSKVRSRTSDQANKIIPGETFSNSKSILETPHNRSGVERANRSKDKKVPTKNIIIIEDSSDSESEADYMIPGSTGHQTRHVDFRLLRKPKPLLDAINRTIDKLFFVRFLSRDPPKYNLRLVQVGPRSDNIENGEYIVTFMTQSHDDMDLPWDQARWRRISKQRQDESTWATLRLSDPSTFVLGPFDFADPKPSPKGKRPSRREFIPQHVWKDLITVVGKNTAGIALPPLSFQLNNSQIRKEDTRRGKRKRA